MDQLKVTTSTDEKLTKVTESAESTATAESVSIMLFRIYAYINTIINNIIQGGEVETISRSTDKISPDVIEEKKDEAETKGQAEEPQPQQEKEQQKTLTETQPQRVEDIMTTTIPEEVSLASLCTYNMILHLMILFLFQVPGDSQPARRNQVS